MAGWSERGRGTLGRRLAHAMREAVHAGLLPDGTRLPPERVLAATLAVSRSTVTAALDELRADGIVASRQGSGTTVLGIGGSELPGSRVAAFLPSWTGIDLAAGNPPNASHLPDVRIDLAALIAGGEGPGVQPLGLVALRRALAAGYTARGRHTDVDQLHVTAGAHQAISLVLAACTGRRATVAVEDPTYPGIFDIAASRGAQVVSVDGDRAGILPEALERTMAARRPDVVYLQTGPHNPLGRVTPVGRRRALAEVLDRHDALVVEDATLAELAFGGRAVPELADLCTRVTVVSVGSLSKIAWGGLRIGWLRGPAPLIERTMHVRLARDLGPSVPSQVLALELLPQLDEIAEGRRATLERATGRAVEGIRAALPEWHVEEPDGGSLLWVRLPVPDTVPFVALAARHGVHIAPGAIARPGRPPTPHVRICVDRADDRVDIGLQRLVLAWQDLIRAPATVLG